MPCWIVLHAATHESTSASSAALAALFWLLEALAEASSVTCRSAIEELMPTITPMLVERLSLSALSLASTTASGTHVPTVLKRSVQMFADASTATACVELKPMLARTDADRHALLAYATARARMITCFIL